MILGKNILSDLEVSNIPPSLQSQTEWGRQFLQTGLQNPSCNIRKLKQRQLPLLALRRTELAAPVALIRSEFQTHIAPHQSILNEACGNATTDTRIKESVEQIVWSPTSLLAPLNEQPAVLKSLITWKTLIVPFISVVLPVVALIIPYFILQLTQSSPPSISSYSSHVRGLLLKQISMPTFLRARSSGDMLGHLFETVFLILTLGSFISGLWNQIQSAIYLRSIVADLEKRGNHLQGIVESSRRILGILKETPAKYRSAFKRHIDSGISALKQLGTMPGGLTGFGVSWNDPKLFLELRDWLGDLDAHLTIASVPNICFPRYSSQPMPLQIKRLFHPQLVNAHRNSANFKHHHHVLLSGPNRGGKSTFCKSLGLSILYAQTWGIAWAESMHFQPFEVFLSALSPTDVLGSLSLFEAEIEFAKGVLNQCKEHRTAFVMMDEIFHSTNAHDGVAASRIFLRALYAIPGVHSLISTHYKDLILEFKSSVHAWQMLATERADGTLDYLYQVAEGISEKSSVMEILRERGLTDSPVICVATDISNEIAKQ